MSNTSTQLSLAGLLNEATEDEIYAEALAIATTIGLPTTTWAPGDPTRSLYYLEAAILVALQSVITGYAQSGFLDYAAVPNPDGSVNPWLAVLAQQVFGVIVPGATFASTTVTLTNTTGAVYVLEPGDISFSNPSTNATYTSTTAVTISGVGTPGATGTVSVVADLAGSASSAAAGEISQITSGFVGLTCTNAAAAVGTDAQPAATTVSQCRNKLGSLSPNGPAAGYSYVALNQALTGIQTVTRVRTYPDSETGDVAVYVAGPSGSVSSPDVAAVQAAINQWATPLCITPTVASANPVTIDVAYSIWLYQSVNQTTAQIEAAIQTALENFFAARPIGGDIIPGSSGALYQSMIAAEIADVFEASTVRVVVTGPSGDTTFANGDVAVLGPVTPTITIIPVPT